uniref:Putative secreted protein ovary overexpressed n=1 Tax=Rhipicephalus microplus TaxID=6941 RepID=A0A6M2D995_RHIMP
MVGPLKHSLMLFICFGSWRNSRYTFAMQYYMHYRLASLHDIHEMIFFKLFQAIPRLFGETPACDAGSKFILFILSCHVFYSQATTPTLEFLQNELLNQFALTCTGTVSGFQISLIRHPSSCF